jgi:hypothetical protein
MIPIFLTSCYETSRTRGRFPIVGSLALVAVLLMAGCASKTAVQDVRPPGSGIAEYRQIASSAQVAVQAALKALVRVKVQTNGCSPQALAALSNQVHRLQVDSLKVRARSQALLVRGDAYFDQWHEQMARIPDSELRSLAETRKPQLQESFRKIKSLSQEGRAAFDPFLSELRQIRNLLEKDVGSVGIDNTQDRIRQAADNGNHVERCLVGITHELDAMQAMVTPLANSTKN